VRATKGLKDIQESKANQEPQENRDQEGHRANKDRQDLLDCLGVQEIG
jgi:hypothetical protein